MPGRDSAARQACPPSSRILRLVGYLYIDQVQCVKGSQASVQVQILSDA